MTGAAGAGAGARFAGAGACGPAGASAGAAPFAGTFSAAASRSCFVTRPEMPVIITSGYLNPAQDRRAGDYGAGEFLGKPFSLKTLAETMAAALRGPE